MSSTITDRLNGLTTSVAVKAPVRLATTANITLSGLQTIDGATTAADDRVLVKNQSTASQNGIYRAQSGSWVRTADFDGSIDVVGGTQVYVTSGTLNGSTYWRVSGTGSKTVGTDSITFETISGTTTLASDLASTASDKGAGLVGFSSGATYDAGTVGSELQDILDDLEPLSSQGDAGLAVLASFGTDEARTAIGLQDNKRILMNTNGANYILNAEDIAPAVHYGLLSAGQTARLDVAGMRNYQPYIVINESALGGVIELDCGAGNHFRGDGISPSVATVTMVKLFPSQVAVLRRTGGNRVHIEIDEQTYWVTSSSYKYRRLRDGTYEVIYTRTATINATTESTADTIATTLDLSNAKVVSIAVNPKSDGSAPPDLLPQVTKLGTTHGLNAYQFAIRNPNAGAISHPIVVRFLDVTGP